MDAEREGDCDDCGVIILEKGSMAENLSQFPLNTYQRRLIIPYPELQSGQVGNASSQVGQYQGLPN